MTNEKNMTRLAPLFIILGGSCWGLIGLFSKHLSSVGLSAMQICFLRCAVSCVLLWLYLLIFDRKQLKIELKDVWMFLGSGILSFVMFGILYFTTQQRATLSVAAVLLYTGPFFVVLMSAILFKEKISGRKVFALILAMAGCVCTTGLLASLMGGSAGALPLSAVLTGIGSGFGYALYSIFGNIALKKYSSVTLTAYTMLFAALSLLPFCAKESLFHIALSGKTPWYVLGIAVISTIIPYLLYSLGLKYTEPGKASVMAFSEPLVATLAGILVFHEKLTVDGAVGIVLIFASIVILNSGLQKKLQIG